MSIHFQLSGSSAENIPVKAQIEPDDLGGEMRPVNVHGAHEACGRVAYLVSFRDEPDVPFVLRCDLASGQWWQDLNDENPAMVETLY